MLANAKISIKIQGLVGILLLLLVSASGIGIYQMMKIGEEIVDVAETDIPITRAITNITIHRLEQAVVLERGFAVAKDLTADPGALKHFQEVAQAFVALGHKVENELKAAEKLVADNIETAHTPEMKKDFTHVLEILKKVDAAHENYERLSEQAFASIEKGKLTQVGTVAEKIEHGQDQIVRDLDAILAEIGKFTADAMLTAEHHEKSAINMLMVVTAGALLFGAVLGILLTRSITRPVIQMTGVMGKLAGGERNVDIPGVGRKDEVGVMADAVQVFKENLIKAEELADAQRKEELAAQERAKRIERLTSDFDSDVASRLDSVSSSAQQMEATAQSLSATADQASSQAGNVASAAEQASANVQTVATAAEELHGSIAEISRQVSQSAEISNKAVKDAARTNTQIQGLAEAASKIGDVVALITDIAEQTNLLALSATIEAARAGEAGKGFAVVASEVKNLASQTAKATEEISDQVSGVQTATDDAVISIQGIGKTISEISEIASSIASAVEEQSAATQEIARNVEQAAKGTEDVSTNIIGVNEAAASTGNASSEVLQATGSLNKETNSLKSNVESFLDSIRAA